MSKQWKSLEEKIFDCIFEPLERLRKEEKLFSLYWYHDEPRWILQQKGIPLRQLEIVLFGQPGNYELSFIAGIFKPKKGWYSSIVDSIPVSTTIKEGKLSYVIDVHKFEEVLIQAYKKVKSL